MDYLKHINIKIAKAKEKLVKKAKRYGLCEDFGQDELKEIVKCKDDLVMTHKLSYEEGNEAMRAIAKFCNWLDNLDLTELANYK